MNLISLKKATNFQGGTFRNYFCSNLLGKSRDPHSKHQSSEADGALPEVEEELVVLPAVVEVGLMVGVSGMLVVGMVDGDGVMGGKTGDDKSKDTAEQEGPHMENKMVLMWPSADRDRPAPLLSADLDASNMQTLTTFYMLMDPTCTSLCQANAISYFS